MVVRGNATKQSLKNILDELSEEDAREVLSFAEFLKLREEQWFIDYVNERTKEALASRKGGKNFFRLEELQGELS